MVENKKKFNLIIFFVLFLILVPKTTYGVFLNIEPGSSINKINDFLVLEIRIDVQEECINAMKIELFFPSNLLQCEYFSNGGSILNLWPESPHIDNERGLVTFIGGIPGGYCKNDIKTDKDSVLIGSLIFKTKEVEEETTGEIFFSKNSQVLINDGLATLAVLNKMKSFFVIIPEVQLNPIDPFLEKKKNEKKDFLDIFHVEIRNDPFLFNGKHALLFYATDQIGIDYYLVSEQKRFGFLPIQKENWEKVQSPYLLKDQNLRSIIKLKALGRTGNEKIKVIHPMLGWQDIAPLIFFLIVMIGVIFYKKIKIKKIKIYAFFKKKKRKK